MPKDKEKKEIVVEAPSKQVISPKKEVEKNIEKALEEERFEVLHFSRKVGSYFGASVVVIGILLLSFFVYSIIGGQIDWLVPSIQESFLGVALWILIGSANVIGGLLLIGTE